MNGRALGGVLAIPLAVAGFCGSQPAWAAPQAGQTPLVIDMALGDGGLMLGQVVDGQGQTLAGTDVTLCVAGRTIATAKCDANGLFAFRGLQGGVYQLTAAEGQAIYRVWAAGTAPPSARQAALVVAGEDLARGQFRGMGGLGNLGSLAGTTPIFVGTVATAVAIPVAVHNADQGFAPPMSP